MSISLNVAIHNLEVLKTFTVGERPVYSKETGEISKEDRIVAVWFRRWWWKAFNSDILATTFEATLPYLKVTEIKMYDINDSESVRKYQEDTDAISRDFPSALEGVKNMIVTYGNGEMAKKIQEIYDKYHKEYEEIPHVLIPTAPEFVEKKNPTRTIVAASNAAAKTRSKMVITQYQQDLHSHIYSELEQRVKKQLKKVEAISPPKEEEKIPAIFNTDLLKKVPQAPVLDLTTDGKEWEVDKPTLLRTQSVRIERPVAPVRDYIRPKFVPHTAFKPFSMSELIIKMKERRQRMGEDKK